LTVIIILFFERITRILILQLLEIQFNIFMFTFRLQIKWWIFKEKFYALVKLSFIIEIETNVAKNLGKFIFVAEEKNILEITPKSVYTINTILTLPLALRLSIASESFPAQISTYVVWYRVYYAFMATLNE
jgi:hypothetical protein